MGIQCAEMGCACWPRAGGQDVGWRRCATRANHPSRQRAAFSASAHPAFACPCLRGHARPSGLEVGQASRQSSRHDRVGVQIDLGRFCLISSRNGSSAFCRRSRRTARFGCTRSRHFGRDTRSAPVCHAFKEIKRLDPAVLHRPTCGGDATWTQFRFLFDLDQLYRGR